MLRRRGSMLRSPPLRTVAFAALLGCAALVPHRAVAGCPAAYTSEQLVNDLTMLQLALRNLDEASFNAAGARLEAGIGCVGNPVPAMVFASAYRYIGAYRYLQKDTANARLWFVSSLELDPTYNWDASELELDSPMRQVFEEERARAQVPVVPIPGKVLAQPAGSTLSLDGRPLDKAAATPDRPHVLQQVATSDRSIRGTWVIQGNDIPAQFLQDADLVGPTPEEAAKAEKASKKLVKEKKSKEQMAQVEYTDSGAVKVERLRPPEKTPLMVIGAVGIAGAAGIYAATFATHDQFENANSTEDLVAAQTLTNALVLTSGGVFLIGAGIGYWGIVLDGGAGVGISGHF